MSEQGQPAPFPHHLLQQAPARRLDYFKAYTVAHPALKQADTQGDRSTSHIPTLKLDAVSPALTQFKWGDYYQRALLLLQAPQVEYEVNYRSTIPVLSRQTREQEVRPWKGITDTAGLRLIFEQALKHRKPYAMLIDEAEHIAKAARGSKLLDQLDHLKSLVIMTQVVYVRYHQPPL